MAGRRTLTRFLMAIIAVVSTQGLWLAFNGWLNWVTRDFEFKESERQATRELRTRLAFTETAWAVVNIAVLAIFLSRRSRKARLLLSGVLAIDAFLMAYLGFQSLNQFDSWIAVAIWWALGLSAVAILFPVWSVEDAARSDDGPGRS
jgi:hypothetical protein